jgi:CxxC motif-containing protein
MTNVETITGEFICVVCPNGCALDAVFEKVADGPSRLVSFTGAKCPRGEAWIKQEIESPMRTIATSVMVTGGEDLLASVRTNRPIPLGKIPAVMTVLRGITLEAPVKIGQIVAENPARTDTEIIATRNVRQVS